MFVFEQITGKIFRLENLTDYYLFYYSLLVANNPRFANDIRGLY